MPITVADKHAGYKLGGKTAERLYVVKGTTDVAAARSALIAAAPATWEGLTRDTDAADVEDLAHQAWLGRVPYKLPNATQKDVGESSFNFEVGGQTVNIRQSPNTLASYAPAGETAPDFEGAIGVSQQGETISVAGVDIVVPRYSFSETHVFAAASIDAAYKGTLFSLVGSTNDASFKGLAAGECLLQGVSGGARGDGDYELTFNFEGLPNETDITVGDITVASKGGWDYLWAYYAEEVDAGRYISKPVAAYVERLYPRKNFSLLGIGTA